MSTGVDTLSLHDALPIYEGVLDVDQDAAGGVNVRQLLDDQDGVEERGAGAAELLRHLDAHDPELEEAPDQVFGRSEEHTSELQSLAYLVCRLLLEKKK